MDFGYSPYYLGIAQGFSIDGVIQSALKANPINVALLLIAGVVGYLYWIEKKRTKIHDLRNFISQLSIRIKLLERKLEISYGEDEEDEIVKLAEKLDAYRDRRRRSEE